MFTHKETGKNIIILDITNNYTKNIIIIHSKNYISNSLIEASLKYGVECTDRYLNVDKLAMWLGQCCLTPL